jgi:hypothetical protein
VQYISQFNKPSKPEVKEVAKDRDYWKRKFKDLSQMVKPLLTAIINFPDKLREFVDSHWQERRFQQQQHNSHNRTGTEVLQWTI